MACLRIGWPTTDRGRRVSPESRDGRPTIRRAATGGRVAADGSRCRLLESSARVESQLEVASVRRPHPAVGWPIMTDPLTWSPINLGRWSGTTVRVHIFLILFVVFELLERRAWRPDTRSPQTAAWLALLLLALAVHELGHAAMASWLGCRARRGPPLAAGQPGRAVGRRRDRADHLLVALAGPADQPGRGRWSSAVGAELRRRPVRLEPVRQRRRLGGPAARRTAKLAAPLTAVWWIGWFGYLNWVLCPGQPDPGPAASTAAGCSGPSWPDTSVVSTRDSMVAPLDRPVVRGGPRAGRAGPAAGLAATSDGLTLIGLAILIELMVRAEARMLEDGGFFDDGVFGYDFSEGYTSLEGSAAKVRPYRESALKRWRRRRSELRRQRRQAREAAEERRMDEILDKLHREGRSRPDRRGAPLPRPRQRQVPQPAQDP